MHRPFLLFTLGILLPSVAVLLLAAERFDAGVDGANAEAHWRVAGMAGVLAEQEIGRAAELAMASARPWHGFSPDDPAVWRARQGDTITGLVASGGQLSVRVLFLEPSGSPRSVDEGLDGVLLTGEGPVAGTDLARLEALTGYGTSLYLRGQRVLSTGGATPAELPTGRSDGDPGGAAGAEGAGAPGAVDPMVDLEDGGRAVLRPVGGEAESALSILAVPPGTRASRVSAERWLVAALLFLFTAVAGWILLTRGRHEPEDGSPRFLLVSLMPVSVTVGVLAFLVVDFDRRAHDVSVRSLSRALAVVEEPGTAATPLEIRRLTGLHATRVVEGSPASTHDSATAAALAAMRMPPPGYTTSGHLESGGERWLYMVRRDRTGGKTILSAAAPLAPVGSLRLAMLILAAILMAWMLVFSRIASPGPRTTREGGAGPAGHDGPGASPLMSASGGFVSRPPG